MNAHTPIAAPLGAKILNGALDVALNSADASLAWLCLFDAAGEREIERAPMERDASGIWRARVFGAGLDARYGFRVDGPWDPARGLRFDASKLLVDPYASRLDRPYALHPSMFEHGVDSGPFVPKCVIEAAIDGEPGHARIAWDRTVIYELNLRGFTRLHPAVPKAERGRFAGLAHPAIIDHLVGLGISSVELMPADAFVDERHLPRLGLTNAWGYNPVIYGAPDPRLAPGGFAEVRAATDALHAAGLEVILDVVVNHNGESDEFGPTLSFRGLDNSSYFRLQADDPARYINDMGCGNCLALDRPIVVDMVVAALKRWMCLGGIDGFRFDLATALGRRESGFDAQAPLFRAIAADPVLSQAKLIAEPWDIGPGGYQLGRFPPAYREWNDRFRDDVRRFWRGDAGFRGALATRLSGSSDVFAGAATPDKSINFVVAHDGFTLADVVAYEHKHNEANGENNRDGSSHEPSWNNGVEGPSDEPAALQARARDMRNLLATLFAARGTPMLAMGAELGHSQRGNNNAYAQDNAISWIDWTKADRDLTAFVARCARARRESRAFAADSWLTGRPFDETTVPDVEWRDADGLFASSGQWEEPEGRTLLAVFAAPTPDGLDRAIFAVNRGHDPANSALPAPRAGFAWKILVDSTTPDGASAAPWCLDERFTLPARSAYMMAEHRPPVGLREGRAVDDALLDRLADAAGISRDWWDVGGRKTVVSRDTKIALLAALRLPAATHGAATQSLRTLVDSTTARKLPAAAVRLAGRAARISVRDALGRAPALLDLAVITEDGRTIAWRSECGTPIRRKLFDGREIVERDFALPDLPPGRHRLALGETSCELTIAPPQAFRPEGAQRKRFGLSAQLYAQRSGASDQGIGDLTTLGELGQAAGHAGAAFLGINPLHQMFPGDRSRCSPYHPSDRRFLDPIHIDVLDADGLPTDENCAAEIASLAPQLHALSAHDAVDYGGVWPLKRAALEARARAFFSAKTAQPQATIFTDYARFVAEGGETLRRFAIFETLVRDFSGDWRRWPDALRRGDVDALNRAAAANPAAIDFQMFAQFLADRGLAKAAARAQAGGLDLGLYRDLAVGAAPDGAEAWSRADELAQGVSVGAPPDPFSEHGQIWHLPPPDPVASARDGWRGLAELYRANMRHAGMLRIDHAMGLTRLFVVPDGARPAQGAYLAYPLDDLIGHIALESVRARCMVVGEDLGTVPEGFREKMSDADMLGMRVLWFERNGRGFAPTRDYPEKAIACASTHDLPTLAGWWIGADVDERLRLGLLTPEEAAAQLAARLEEKHALSAALRQAGALADDPDFTAPVTDAFAAAVHGFAAQAGSSLASAQIDDLAGETVATNLPGTDRERPNWRHRLRREAAALAEWPRARAVLGALAEGRK